MVHSPLRRAADTAAIVWGERAGPKHALHDLRELDLHSWEGALKTEAAARDPGAYAAWKDRPAAFQLDGRRPVCDLWRRARSVWRALLDPGGALRGSLGPAQGAPSVLLVAHQGMNKALISTALGLEEDAFRSLPQVGGQRRGGGGKDEAYWSSGGWGLYGGVQPSLACMRWTGAGPMNSMQ